MNTDAPTDVGGCVQSSSAREDRSTDAGSTRQRRYPESPTFTAPTQLTSDTPITNALYLSICLKEKCNVKEDWVVENVEVSKIKSDAEVYEKIRAVFEKHLPHPFGKMPLRRYFYRRIEEIRISNIILGKRGVRACVPLRRVKCDPKLYDIDSSGPAISTDALTKRVLRPPAHGLEPYEWHFMPKRRATPLEWRHPQDGQLGNVNAGLGIEIVLRSKNKRRIKAIHRLAKIIGAVLLVLTISLAFTVLKESKVVTLTVGMLVSSILPVFMAALAPLA